MSSTMSLPSVRVKTLAILGSLMLMALGGCATAPTGNVRDLLSGVPAEALSQADSAAASGDSMTAAARYLELASQAQAPARQGLELLAAEAYYEAGASNRAMGTLSRIDSSRLNAAGRTQERLLGARAALQASLAERTLSELNRLGSFGLPASLRAERLGMEAAAYRLNGDFVQAAATLDGLGNSLEDPAERLANQVSILFTLSVLPDAELARLEKSGPGRIRSWASLSRLLAKHESADAAMMGSYRQWRARHGGRSISEQLPKAYYAALAGDYPAGSTAWVLLPQSGRFSGASAAIGRGLRDADGLNQSGHRPRLRNANSAENAEGAYQQAVSGGANMVIGPLQKSSVDSLTVGGRLPVATLALNRNSEPRTLPEQMTQFALSPEDEAISAANHAWASQLRSALLLYPQGPWGNRMAGAFRDHWRALGGEIAGEAVYGATDASMGTGIETLLSPGKGDVIFMVATSGDAQRLWSRLYAANIRKLPTLATSHVYGGDPSDGAALAGVYFVDVPWLLDSDKGGFAPLQRLRRNAPAASQQGATATRLYAMGLDSYRLAPRADEMRAHPGHFFPGASGGLTIDGTGRIRRSLILARFEGSGPVPQDRIATASGQQ